MSNNLKQLEGGRAAEAYKYALQAKRSSSDSTQLEDFEGKFFKAKNYKSYVKKAPMWIKTNGVGAAFAFILSKQESGLKKIHGQDYQPGIHRDYPQNAYGLLYHQISAWLKSETKKYLLKGREDQELVKILTELKSHEYRAVTIEVLALLNWLRRFADGLIEGEDQEDS